MANLTKIKPDRSKYIGIKVSDKLFKEVSRQALMKDLNISEFVRLALVVAIDNEKQMQAALAKRRK